MLRLCIRQSGQSARCVPRVAGAKLEEGIQQVVSGFSFHAKEYIHFLTIVTQAWEEPGWCVRWRWRQDSDQAICTLGCIAQRRR